MGGGGGGGGEILEGFNVRGKGVGDGLAASNRSLSELAACIETVGQRERV